MIVQKLTDAPKNRPVCGLPNGTFNVWAAGEPQPDWYQVPQPAIPDVTSWQLTQALIETGMISAVETLISTTTDPLIKYGWEKASIYSRGDSVVRAAQTGLNLTDTQVDSLFLLAASK